MTSGYVSVSVLKDTLKSKIEELEEGVFDDYVILQNSKPVVVMLAFEVYQRYKALLTSPMQEIAAYLAPALSAPATISNEGLITTPAVPIVAPEPEEKL